MIEVHTSGAPIDEAARALTKRITDYGKKDILLLFSGGSSLAIVDHMHPRILSKQCTLSVLDERFTYEKEKSNFSKLERTTFFKAAVETGIPYIDPQPTETETLEDAAKRFDLALKHWHVTHADGVVLATVGIGQDGHTAGVLPVEDSEMFTKMFLKEHHCAVGYEVPPEMNPHTQRITTTLSYIMRHINFACIYATGTQKKDVYTETS
jgi:6-phosphogluconolactonase/glucosamine-6-phosphate isomerase/deaminase